MANGLCDRGSINEIVTQFSSYKAWRIYFETFCFIAVGSPQYRLVSIICVN